MPRRLSPFPAPRPGPRLRPALVPALVLALALALLLGPAAATAKTYVSAGAENIFFYATGADGQSVLLTVAPLSELQRLQHGQLSAVTAGTDTGRNYYFSYTDNFPTTGYAEAKGLTVPEILAWVQGVTSVPGADKLTFTGRDEIGLSATDFYGGYRFYSAETLYGQPRYYFPDLYDARIGWKREWEFDDDLSKFASDVTWDVYETEYRDGDPYYEDKAAVFAGGIPTTSLLAVEHLSGRTEGSLAASLEVGISEEIAANGGVVTGSLAGRLSTEKSLCLYIPQSEAGLFIAHRTAYGNVKWVYSLLLRPDGPSPLVAQGAVEAPVIEFSPAPDGRTLMVSVSCASAGAAIYYSMDGSPQIPYTGPVSLDITGVDLAAEGVYFYATAVREGYADAGIVSARWYPAAPAVRATGAGGGETLLGADVVLSAGPDVTPEVWREWLEKIRQVTLRAPGDQEARVLSPESYTTDAAAGTLTLKAELFPALSDYRLLLDAEEYARREITLTLKRPAPRITAEAGVLGRAAALTFADPDYHRNLNVLEIRAADGTKLKNIGQSDLEKAPGRLTMKESYFSGPNPGITAPGLYTLRLANKYFIPETREVNITLTPADGAAGGAYYRLQPLGPEAEAGAEAGAGAAGAGETTLTVTLNVPAAGQYRLYGGQYSVEIDENLAELRLIRVEEPWRAEVVRDEARRIATVRFISLNPEGLSVPALSPIGRLTLRPLAESGRAARGTEARLSGADGSNREVYAGDWRLEPGPLAAYADADPGAWYATAVGYALARGWLTPTGAGLLAPDAAVSRGEFFLLLSRLAAIEEAAYNARSFPDVLSGAPYRAAVKWAADQGLARADESGLIRPEETIGRDEALVLLQRYAGAAAAGAAETVAEAGVGVTGPGAWTEGLTRAGAAQMLYAFRACAGRAPAAAPPEGGAEKVLLSWTEDPAATRTFTWQDSAGVSRAWLRWGRTPLSEAGRTEAAVVASGAGRVRFEATARGLSPGSEYYYSLGAEETGWSAPVSFTTAPALPDSFSFLFLGDINPAAVSEYDDWGLLLAEAAERSPDLAFALLGGDMVESGRPEEWDGFLTNAAPVFSRLPLLSVNGNHESNYIGGKPLEYLNIFALPRNGPPGFEEEFYSFDYGPAHIIVLNSHVYSGEQNLSEAELTALSEWIRQDLAASPAVWKIAAFHHPAYALARDTVSDGVRANWAPLLEAGGVQLALVGHQHVYSRSRPLTDGAADYENGVVYIMGNSGLKFYTTADESFSERIVYGAANYQVVSLSAEALTATTFAAGGAELDAVTLAARGPSGPGRADVSGDGRADFQDMWLVEEAILAGQAAAELDVNGDGTVDILDAQAAYLGGSGS